MWKGTKKNGEEDRDKSCMERSEERWKKYRKQVTNTKEYKDRWKRNFRGRKQDEMEKAKRKERVGSRKE
jgi:hypothetical protein